MAAPNDDVASRVKTAAEAMVGSKAIDGGKDKGGIDCFALIDKVLRLAEVGAKSAADFGTVTPTADYVWGDPVELKDIQPGYILQFRNHIVTSHTEKLGDSKWQKSNERTANRPHHTAVVLEVRKDGSVVVVEQNVKPDPKSITRSVILRLEDGDDTRYVNNQEKLILKVTGTVKAYRPVPRPKGTMLFPPSERSGLGGRRLLAYTPCDGGPKRRPGPLGNG